MQKTLAIPETCTCFLAPVFALLAIACAATAPACRQIPAGSAAGIADSRIKEFPRLIQEFSEAGGSFRSDNFTSNETSYLHVADRLGELRKGGAYIGVGPEQNFTYIALTRPEIAFIVDVRRQAVLQHLLYKAIFHASPSRALFLSHLLSRPLDGRFTPGRHVPLPDIVEYFTRAPASEEAFRSNLHRFRTMIRTEFRVPLSEQDLAQLEHVYSAFRKGGMEISFRFGGSSWGGGYGRFPTLRELLLQQDLNGEQRSFLASDADYSFVRNLQLRNRVIPVVGDFAGPKALASVGEYLRRNRYTLRAFYTSNVEQFLFRNGVFEAYAANVEKLPFDQDSVVIRAVPARGAHHPAQAPGHRVATVLQRISVLLRDYRQGRSDDYWSLVTTNYIAGGKR